MNGSRRGPGGLIGRLVLGASLLWTGCAEETYRQAYAPGEIDYYDDLYAATAVGANHAWAAGYFGSIYRTTDAGASWRKLPTDTEMSIYDISFADEKHGWAVGRRGYIIHTEDGGDTWQRQTTPREPPQHIFSIAAIDADRAWAVGEWGGRYFTEDGGKTWQDRSFTMDESHPGWHYLTEFDLEKAAKGERIYDDLYLNDVSFLDADHGWIAGEYGIVYYTHDAGNTWEKSRIVGELTIPELAFDAGSTEVIKDRWPQLFEAAERLNEKEYLRVRIEGFMTEAELKAADGETVLADERAERVRDFLEGESVSQERLGLQNTTPFDREGVDMEAFTKSKLSDHPHVKIEVLETPFLFDVKFADPQNGLVAGLGGVILVTHDGGQSLQYAKTGSRLAFFGVAPAAQGAVAVGEKGVQRVSFDGGHTWVRPDKGFPEIFGFLRAIDFGDSDHGWIVGASGLVLRSSDGGLTWMQVLPPSQDGLPKAAAAGE